MKKLSAVILSVAMLLAFASCDAAPSGTSSKTGSDAASGAESGDVTSVDFSDPYKLTLAATEKLNAQKAYDMTTDTGIVMVLNPELTLNVNTVYDTQFIDNGEDGEYYDSKTTTLIGLADPSTTIKYYKGGKYYDIAADKTVTSQDMTFAELKDTDIGSLTYSFGEKQFEGATVEQDGDNYIVTTTVPVDDDNMERIDGLLNMTNLFNKDSRTKVVYKDVTTVLTIDKDANLIGLNMVIGVTFNDENNNDCSIDMDIDVTFNKVGDAVVVTIPEGIPAE